MPVFDQATRRRLSVEASCDPRTLDKIIKGNSVKGLAGYRAREALVRAGFALPDVDAGTSTPEVGHE